MLKTPSFVNRNVVTSATLWCCGDAVAQHIERRKRKLSPKINSVYRSIGTLAFGAMIVAPLGQKWYHFMDTTLSTVWKLNKPSVISCKIVLESLIWNPALTATYFLWMGIVNQHSPRQIGATFRTTYIPTVFVETTYWPLFDLINFTIVPVHHQLLFVNAVSLLDTAFVSWKYSLSE